MANLIQQLKDNERPFGLMSEEMQEKAKAIGFPGNFRTYLWPNFGGIIANLEYGYSGQLTYCLRANYEDEPEIVERIIMPAEAGLVCLSSVVGVENLLISECVNDPDFVGFKFADGCWRTSPIYYQMPTMCNDQIHPNKTTDFAEMIVLHASHVLFRRKKQE